MADLFKVMFLDSQIAQHFTCGKDKCRYLTTFGIGPHFQDLLQSRINKSNGIVLLFDESLNSELEKKQMDIHARFWDGDEVVTRYLTSCFVGHGTAEDLRKAITSGLQTAQPNCSQLIQLSMDGPAVNHKLHRLLATDLQSVVSPSFQLIDIGTCSLHVLHNSFKAGHEATSWDIGSFLSSLHYLFHDSPARKEDIIVLTGSMMRLEYCSHRWLENIPVAERALKVWPHVKMYIKDILAKKKPPAIKSFTFLVNCINNKLLEAKLEAFISVARIIHPCLQRYQTQTPMLPFMAEDLALCQRSLLQRFVKQNKVQDCSMTSLVELDLQDPSNLLDVGKVDPGFKAKQIVQSLENVSPKELLAFKIDCRNFARAAAEKLRKKSALDSKLVRNIQWLNPQILRDNPSRARRQLETTLTILVNNNSVEADKVDSLKLTFDRWLSDKPDLKFCTTTERLDKFYYCLLAGNTTYKDLWEVIRMLLTLSHGQAQVERGFSVNKEIMTTSMKERTLIAQRVICDHVTTVGGLGNVVWHVHSRHVNCCQQCKEYISACCGGGKGRGREGRSQEEEGGRSGGVERVEKRARVEQDARTLEDKVDVLMDKAEATKSLSFLVEACSHRRSAKEKRALLVELDQAISKKAKEVEAE